ncbi:MAG: YkgJ family cysteine cluster protein, partial [Desulfobacterales bacterium]|nr:YkgJ family cysteine cluster protein [Desulfobacterales bacterium]
MNLNKKLDVLDRIYRIYDDFARNLDVACKRYCDSCCTRNVTLTTLEGYRIVDFLISDGKTDLFNNIREDLRKGRFQPIITTNRLAELSIAEKDIPDENSHYFQGECPILTDRQCPVYKARPFGCRCFVSKHSCREKGY